MYHVAQIETKFNGIETVVREKLPTGHGVTIIKTSKSKIQAVRYAHNFSDPNTGIIIENTRFSDEEVAELLEKWEEENRTRSK